MRGAPGNCEFIVLGASGAKKVLKNSYFAESVRACRVLASACARVDLHDSVPFAFLASCAPMLMWMPARCACHTRTSSVVQG